MKKSFLFFPFLIIGCVYKSEPTCEGEAEVTTVVTLSNAFIEGEMLAVAKGDSTYTERYVISGYAKNRYGYVMPRAILWQTENLDFLELMPVEADVGTDVRVIVKKDLFDNSGVEPEGEIVGCVQNDCKYFIDDQSCPSCTSQICSYPPLKIRGIINIEGIWRLEGATFPFPVDIFIQQTGNRVDTVFATNASIQGRQVVFDLSEFRYSCELSDREHCQGEVVNTATGENLGEWKATKTQ
jgi:hypothetical protein